MPNENVGITPDIEVETALTEVTEVLPLEAIATDDSNQDEENTNVDAIHSGIEGDALVDEFERCLSVLKSELGYVEDDIFSWDAAAAFLIIPIKNTDSLNKKENNKSRATQIQLTSGKNDIYGNSKTDDFFPTLVLNKTFPSWRLEIPVMISVANLNRLSEQNEITEEKWEKDTIKLRRDILNVDAVGKGNPLLQICFANDLKPLRQRLAVDDYLVVAKLKKSDTYFAFGVRSTADLGTKKRMVASQDSLRDDTVFKYVERDAVSEKGHVEHHNNEFAIDRLPDAFDSSVKTRFVRSLLAKPFVILTGNSGAGKTRIAKQLSEYLEVEDENKEKNWLIVPVGADWTDNSRVMGYYNPLADNGKGKYEKTGILRLIERANVHPNIPYFLILDEMNLSHVERYFSDFLSHMETPDNPFEIVGYTADTVDEDQDDAAEDAIAGRIRYPDNLFVVGTVNIDETTYMFSPKVLDRANVIEFKPKQKDVMDLFNGSVGYTKVTSANDGTAESFLGLAKSVRKGESDLDDAQITIVREVFDNIYAITEKHGFEFAYRTVKEIRRYISAALKMTADPEQFDLYSVIDEQLLQKVLPKIHGNRKEIGNMLDELKTECDKPGRELPLSSAKIEQMKGKLDAVQYASFI